jgi:DNA-directed RNA polymerase subunit RPC12/RpoP
VSKEPARKALSDDELVSLGVTADLRFGRARTAGLTPPSDIEKLLFGGLIFLAGAGLYIHLDLAPWLPIEVSPLTRFWLTPLSMAVMFLGGLYWIIAIGKRVAALLSAGWNKLFPKQPRIICRECRTKSLARHYLEGLGCPHCGSTLVECARCGRTYPVQHYLAGIGCSHCGYKKMTLYW